MRDWRHATVETVAKGVLWAFRLTKGWLARVLGGAASLMFIMWGVTGGGAWTKGQWIFWVGVGFAVAAFVAEFLVQRPSYMQLSQLREEAERRAAEKSDALERAVEILLVRLANHCALEGHSDRLSVYAYHDDKFFMVARHAKNPDLRKRRRGSYPADQGAIGKAWNEDLGQALVTMRTGRESWDKSAKKQGMDEATIAGIRMRSLGLGGYRLEAQDRSVGVLVIESTTSARIKQTHLDLIADSQIVAAIAELVEAFALMTPAGESYEAARSTKPARKWQSVSPRAQLALTAGKA